MSKYTVDSVYDRLDDDVSREIFLLKHRYSNRVFYEDDISGHGSSFLKELFLINPFTKSHADSKLWLIGKSPIWELALKELDFGGVIESESDVQRYLESGDGKKACIYASWWNDKSYQSFRRLGIPAEDILWCWCGEQYFDVFPRRDLETFIDCGAYDGQSSLGYLIKQSGKDKNIIQFEPLFSIKESLQKANTLMNKYCDIRTYDSAVCDVVGHLPFSHASDGFSSKLSNESPDGGVWKTCTIDSVLQGLKGFPVLDNVFIKMDVEGAEVSALKGASNLIREKNPRLAISIYHNLNDYIDVPRCILDINESYRFKIRHYTNTYVETVLYGYVPEERVTDVK